MPPRILPLALLALSTFACTHPARVRAGAVVTTIPASQLVLADSLESRALTHVLPGYPYALQLQGVSARFFAFAIVDTAGRVDMRSVRFGRGAGRPFYDAVCKVLPRMRFAPIRREGEARPALVVLPYSFAIGGDTAAGRPQTPEAEVFRQIIRRTGMDSVLTSVAPRPHC